MKKAHRYLTAAGVVLLVLAASIMIYSLVDDHLAGQRARFVLEQMEQDIPTQDNGEKQPLSLPDEPAVSAGPDGTDPAEDSLPIVSQDTRPDPEPDQGGAAVQPQTAPRPVATRPVYDTAGVLSIPEFRLELPVLSECTDPLLRVSVCMFSGSLKEEGPRRLVIAGHNYRSHFGRIPKLSLGGEVKFTGLDGIEHLYRVSEVIEIAADDPAALMAGEWDITLFTCNFDNTRRILVRCLKQD